MKSAPSRWRLIQATALAVALAGCRLATSDGTPEPTPGDPTSMPAESAQASPDSAPGGGVQICNQHDASPIPPGYDSNGCWGTSDYFGRPPEVIPEPGPAAPLIRIEGSGTAPLGIEGTLFFVRAVSPSGTVVLDREWEWPSLEQSVPPGAYQVTAYARSCDANCDYLDPPAFSCTVEILAEPSMTYTMTYLVGNGASVSCHASKAATGH